MNMIVPHYESDNHAIRIRPNMVQENDKQVLAYITITAGSGKVHISADLVAELGEMLHDLYQDLIQ